MGRHANKHARFAPDESSQRYRSHQSTSLGGRQVTVAELLSRDRTDTTTGGRSSTTSSHSQDAKTREGQKTQDSKSSRHTPRTLFPEKSGAPQRYIPERVRPTSTTRPASTTAAKKQEDLTPFPPRQKVGRPRSDKRAPTPPSSKKPQTSDSHFFHRPSTSISTKSSTPVGPSKRRRHSVVAASIGVGVVACALFGGTFAAWQSGILGTPGSSNSHHAASNTVNDQNGDETADGGDGNKLGGSTHQQGDGEPKGDQEVRLSTIKNRPTTAPLPDDAIPANAAAIQDDEAGQFNLAYTGSDSTPAAFAVATRRAFAQQYVKTLNTNMTVDVKSPVSGRNIAMNCRDNGGFVTCEGPDDERVYIQ